MELEILLWFTLGALVEAIISSIWQVIRSTRGVLRIDHSNPAKDVYRIELDNLDAINRKKYVELKIDHDAHLSQK